MKTQVKNLKVDQRFIRPDIPYHLNNNYVTCKVQWIARIFHNSYLIDSGVSLFELNGNSFVEVVTKGD